MMKTWTRQAGERLEEYLELRITKEGLVGEEARELKEDLKAHVQEETEQYAEKEITSVELTKALDLLEDGIQPTPAVRSVGTALKAFAIVIPFGVTLFEILIHFCGGVFFDPVPTWAHKALVLSVPLLNWWLITRGNRAPSLWQGVAAGVAMTVSAIYTLLFFPLIPASVMALIFFGMGLLSLTPLFAWIATHKISRNCRERVARPWQYRRGWWAGLVGVIIIFFTLESSALRTRYHLSRALSSNAEEAQEGIESLRKSHSQATLLRACYEGNRGTSMATDISGWIRKGWNIPAVMLGQASSIPSLNSDKVRTIFFRVTGKSFNSVKPPRTILEKPLFGGGGRDFEGIEWDDHLGGDEVAVRVRDLDLVESRFDGHADSISGLGYGEWTMVFRNDSPQAKEARCQVRLPRGGRVSRLTLWVNGEPREAAFNSVAKVKKAYKSVAVVQRRDPVLVTMAGPDTIMVQCFPVPALGKMKIRFGITAPLTDNHWELPRIIEQNYGIPDDTRHSLWLQADQPFDLSGISKAGSRKDGSMHSCHTEMSLKLVADKLCALRFAGEVEEVKTVWCEDPFGKEGERFLERQKTTTQVEPADRLVVVIDGSASMKEYRHELQKVLKNFQSAEILVADDGVRKLSWGTLWQHNFSGGRDNGPALEKAVSLAKDAERGVVLWLHGPQAVALSQTESLIQLLERGTRRPELYAVELTPGPNRIAETLGKHGLLKRGPSLFNLERDLGRFFGDLVKGNTAEEITWTRRANATEAGGKKVWDHLARQWAIEISESNHPERAAIAAQYQLVTPVSGAVVLETMKQFKEHGLTPVDVNSTPTVPAVPEPSSLLLTALASLLFCLRRRRA